MFHLYNTVQDSNNKDISPRISSDEYIGISTGNWGCGAFGGNPEIKSMIQWIAASQVQEKWMLGLAVHVNHVRFHLNATTDCAGVNLISMAFVTVIWIFLIVQALRPFVNYYTFEDASLERLGEVLYIPSTQPSLSFRVKKVGP